MKIAYFRDYDSDGLYSNRKFYPTGRWKEKTLSSGRVKMLVEHKGWIFRKWVDEDDIYFAEETKEAVFTCKRS